MVLPVTPDTEVPEDFFDRTPADVREEYKRMSRNRELLGQFCSRWRRDWVALPTIDLSCSSVTN